MFQDKAGNWSPAFSSSIIFDTRPRIQITSPIGVINNKTPYLIYSVSDGTVVVRVDGVVVNKISGNTLDPLEDGVHTVQVEATNASGTLTAEESFTVDTTPPTVSITSPSSGTVSDEPQLNYTISEGHVIVRVDGSVVNVSSGDTLYGLKDGTHTVRVEATDIAGNTGYVEVSFTINTSLILSLDPDASNVYCNGTEKSIVGSSSFTEGMQIPTEGTNGVLIDLPIDGSTISGPKTIIKGAMDTTIPVSRIIIEVNSAATGTTSYAAQINGNYFAAKVSIAEGTNTIRAISFDKNGDQHQASVSVYVMAQTGNLELSATPGTGTPTVQQDGQNGLQVVLRADAALSNAISSYTWDFSGSGSNDLKCYTHSAVTADYQQTGLYLASVTVRDTSGERYSDLVIVNVLDKTSIDLQVKETWDGMKTAMMSNDIQKAIGNFAAESQDQYAAIFGAIGDGLGTLAQEMQDISLIYVRDGIAKYRIRRSEPAGEMTYYIYFIQDENGIWKILKF